MEPALTVLIDQPVLLSGVSLLLGYRLRCRDR